MIMLNATEDEPVVLVVGHIESVGPSKAGDPLKSPAMIRMVSGQMYIVTQSVEQVLINLTQPRVPETPTPAFG
jgi:hypothetical protein